MPTIPRFLWEYQLPLGLTILGIVVLLYLFSWYKDVNHDRTDFKKLLKTLKKDIQEIKDKLSGAPAATQPGSPLELSIYGESLSESLGAKKWASETAAALVERVRGKDAYEVQEFCNTYVLDEYQPSDLQGQRIRECMYQKGATRTHVNEVLALVLRDELLDKLGLMHLAP